MKLEDIDKIPDGIEDSNVAPKAILRTIVAIAPDLERRAAALVGAIMLLVQGEPDEPELIGALAGAMQAAATIARAVRGDKPRLPCGRPNCRRCNPKPQGLPS